MSSYELPGNRGKELLASDLIQTALTLVENEADPVTRGHMLSAAIGEGLPLSADVVLENLSGLPDDDDRTPDTATPYQRKYYLAQEAVGAFATQGRFGETDQLIAYIRSRDPYTYLCSVIEVVKHGYGGPLDAYLRFTTTELCNLANDPGHYAYPEKSERTKLNYQQLYLEEYLCAAAQHGQDIFAPGTEFSAMHFRINELDAALQRDPWQSQRRLRDYSRAYAEGGHAAEAIALKDVVHDHALRAEICLDILETVEALDDATETALLAETMEQLEQIESCYGQCGYEHSEPKSPPGTIRLHILRYQAKQSPRDAWQVKELLDKPGFYFPNEQLLAHLEVYGQTGDEHERGLTLSFLNNHTYYKPEIVSDYVRQVAEADRKWGRTISYEGEDVPLAGWEIERIFWGIEKYFGTDVSDTSREQNRYERGEPTDSDKRLLAALGMGLEEYQASAVGPLSASFGESAQEQDLSNCLAQRDRAHVVLATQLAEHGAMQSCRYFIEKIDGNEDKVRALVAVAGRLGA